MQLDMLKSLTEAISSTGALAKFGMIVSKADGEVEYDDLEDAQIFLDKKSFEAGVVAAFKTYLTDARELDPGSLAELKSFDDVEGHEEWDSWVNQYVYIVDKF